MTPLFDGCASVHDGMKGRYGVRVLAEIGVGFRLFTAWVGKHLLDSVIEDLGQGYTSDSGPETLVFVHTHTHTYSHIRTCSHTLTHAHRRNCWRGSDLSPKQPVKVFPFKIDLSL